MRTGSFLVTAALLLALAGCVPVDSHPSSSPTGSATPVFASDAEALAAAEKAYLAYLKVSDEIGHDGGEDPDRINPTVTLDRRAIEQRGSKSLKDHGLHTSGATAFSNPSLQRVTRSGDDVEVAFYACWDVTAVRVLDSTDRDVTPVDRVNRRTLEVVVTTVDGRLPLLLESDDAWSGDSSC